MIETGLLRSQAVSGLAVARDGNSQRVSGTSLLAHFLRQLKAVHAGQAEIEQHDFRLELRCDVKRMLRFVRNAHVISIRFKNHR